jgi:hypothetical protein
MAKRDKLIIKKPKNELCRDTTVWISNKANALIDDIVKKSGQTKAIVASKMLEFAYEHTFVEEDESDEEANTQ